MTMSSLRRYIVGQFSRPHGLLGKVAGWIMAHRQSNQKRNLWTVGLLDIQKADRVLEIGFGPGFALERIAEQAADGFVVGVDHSPTMVRAATKRNYAAVKAGRMKLLVGTVENVHKECPSGENGFQKAFAVNVSGFWQDPVAEMRAIYDLMAPGGLFALTFQPRHKNASDADAVAAADRMAGQISQAGFENIRCEQLHTVSPIAICVIAEKPHA